MSEIVILSGSPSKSSRSELVLTYIGSLLRKQGYTVKHISVQDIPPEDLFYARFDSPEVQEVAASLQQAKGVIVGSPVYKAAYSGVLKALLDLLPQDVLQDTPVFPLMTGGSGSHLLAIEFTLKPLLATLKGQNIKGVYFLDKQIDKESPAQPIADSDCVERLGKQLDYFTELINRQKTAVY